MVTITKLSSSEGFCGITIAIDRYKSDRTYLHMLQLGWIPVALCRVTKVNTRDMYTMDLCYLKKTLNNCRMEEHVADVEGEGCWALVVHI